MISKSTVKRLERDLEKAQPTKELPCYVWFEKGKYFCNGKAYNSYEELLEAYGLPKNTGGIVYYWGDYGEGDPK